MRLLSISFSEETGSRVTKGDISWMYEAQNQAQTTAEICAKGPDKKIAVEREFSLVLHKTVVKRDTTHMCFFRVARFQNPSSFVV